MDVEKNPGCRNDEQYFIWLAVWHRDFIDELEKPPCLFSSLTSTLTSTLTLTLLAGGHAQTSGIYLIYLLDQEQRHTSTSSNLASEGLRSCVLLKLHPHPHPLLHASLVGGHHSAELWRNYPCRAVTTALHCPSSSQPASCYRPGPRKTESDAQWPYQLYYLDAAAIQPHNALDSKLPGSAASNPYPLRQAKTGFLTHLRTSFVHARASGWTARFGQFQNPDTRGVQHLGRRGAEGGHILFLPAALESIQQL
ncbi:hypothetical protein NA56DRAFT_704834 [Hyaloscypha hepaticicola]|uniref:Uncharacterized protein n=1 Tax=Hyaloscypha hepaticicola TaxID=2082293 RepID=A0A2J6Q174_9HELO|nr:hypothetical protein NA56DRAFT_704834 [Hyaloscypha hepaticicola]